MKNFIERKADLVKDIIACMIPYQLVDSRAVARLPTGVWNVFSDTDNVAFTPMSMIVNAALEPHYASGALRAASFKWDIDNDRTTLSMDVLWDQHHMLGDHDSFVLFIST